jgi:hypothetical protein
MRTSSSSSTTSTTGFDASSANTSETCSWEALDIIAVSFRLQRAQCQIGRTMMAASRAKAPATMIARFWSCRPLRVALSETSHHLRAADLARPRPFWPRTRAPRCQPNSGPKHQLQKAGPDPPFRCLTRNRYGGPCPPPGTATWSRSTHSKTDKLDLDEKASGAMVGFYLGQNTLAKASVTLRFGR